MPKLIRFRLTSYAEILLGLDDQALVQQTFPTFKRISALWCEASQSDLVVIQDDCNERSLDVVGGFEHTRAERDVMKRAALSCLQALDQADEDRIAEEARIDNNNRAFRELAEEGTRIIAAQKISEAQAKRAAAAGRPTPPPVKPEDLTAIPLTRKEIIERAKHLADVDRAQRERERERRDVITPAFSPTVWVRVFDETTDTEVYDNAMALDSLIVRGTSEYHEAVRELEKSRRCWWRNDTGELRYITPAR